MKNEINYFQHYMEANQDVSISSVDNYSTENYDGTPRTNPGQAVTALQPGTWLRFKAEIPAGNFTACMLFASTLKKNQQVQICIGDTESTPVWHFNISPVSVENFFTDTCSSSVSLDLTGEQEIYFLFPDGFEGYLNWFVFCQNIQTETLEDKKRRLQWFDKARFGHMMHWGAYSVLGKDAWYMHNAGIPKEQYIEEACIPFDPHNYDPEYWAYVIESTGQKYLTVTTKHHDGFAMFDTNITEFAPYDVVNTASVHASVLRPLADACRARGIMFCCYYSLLDWGNVNEVAIEDAAEVDPETIDPQDVTRYLSEIKEHLKELVEIFDPVLIWFDGGNAAFLNDDVSNEIAGYLHRLSPQIIINSHLGGEKTDYTTYEQSIPTETQNQQWESCMTMNDSWGYVTDDTNWKSTDMLLHHLLDSASKGGNLLLNTGPTPDGVIPQPCTDRLAELGEWMSTWGTAVYGTRAGTLDTSAQPGVFCTVSPEHTAYITVTQWPDTRQVLIDAPQAAPLKLYWLDQPDTLLDYKISNGQMVITLPEQQWDPLGVVLAIEFDRLPQPRLYPDKALFRNATASNVWDNNTSEYGPQFATDGDSSTRWATDEVNEPVTLEIQLTQPETFSRVNFIQLSGRIDTFVIDALVNDEWQTILTGSDPAVNWTGYLNAPVTASAVRLTINSLLDRTEPASLYSFSLYDTQETLLPVDLLVNVARGADASASSVWNNNASYVATMAIDGNPSTRWAASDNPEYPITFTVNFIKQETFDLIKISEYINGSGERISSFSLQIFDDNAAVWSDVYQGTDINETIILPSLTRSTAVRLLIHAGDLYNGPTLREFAVYQTMRESEPVLSADELLEAEARRCFEYFWREANTTEGSKGYGLIADENNSRRSSIAGTGFGLSGLVIAAERGWISADKAQQRCQKSLQVLLDYVPTYKGFFYHFMDMDSLDTAGSKVSTVDTMLALNGILTAAQYFGGECATLAQQIFDRVEWRNAIAPDGNFTMSWDSEGNMSNSTWGGYAEQFCMYPMAAGSTTWAPDQPADMFYSLERKYGHYKDSGDLVYVWGGTLFTYQFSHAWLDFRKLWDRAGTDWWQNSINASQANRQFCIDNSDVFPSLGKNDWGLTSCDGPAGYHAYGAPPSGNIGANNVHFTDGTVTPSGPLGSLPFLPEDVRVAILHWYQDPRLWTPYGFLESYNLSSAAPWYCSTVSGLIKGLTLLMIENWRSGLVWNTYMAHPVLQRGMPVIFDTQQPEY